MIPALLSVAIVAALALRAYLFRRAVWRALRPHWRALGDIEEDMGLWPSRMGSFPRKTSKVEILLEGWVRRGLIVSAWGSTSRDRRLSMAYIGEPIYSKPETRS